MGWCVWMGNETPPMKWSLRSSLCDACKDVTMPFHSLQVFRLMKMYFSRQFNAQYRSTVKQSVSLLFPASMPWFVERITSTHPPRQTVKLRPGIRATEDANCTKGYSGVKYRKIGPSSTQWEHENGIGNRNGAERRCDETETTAKYAKRANGNLGRDGRVSVSVLVGVCLKAKDFRKVVSPTTTDHNVVVHAAALQTHTLALPPHERNKIICFDPPASAFSLT